MQTVQPVSDPVKALHGLMRKLRQIRKKFNFFSRSGKLTQMRRTRKPVKLDRRDANWKRRLENYENWIKTC